MTEQEQTLPPEGWYPDPEHPDYLRWWDGFQWTLRKRTQAVQTGQSGEPTGRSFEILARAIGALIGLTMVLLISEILVLTWGFFSVDDAFESGDVGRLTTIDNTEIALLIAQAASVVLAGVCWMVWQYQLARSMQGLIRGPAMHAFSWIIPIGNLWLPVQNIKDLWIRALPRHGRAVIAWWWTGWILGGVLTRVSMAIAEDVDTASGWQSYYVVSAVAALMWLCAGFLGLRIMWSLTSAVRGKSITPEGRPAIG